MSGPCSSCVYESKWDVFRACVRVLACAFHNFSAYVYVCVFVCVTVICMLCMFLVYSVLAIGHVFVCMPFKYSPFDGVCMCKCMFPMI